MKVKCQDLCLPVCLEEIPAVRQRDEQIFKDWTLEGIVMQQYGRILLRDKITREELAQL